MPAAKLTPQQVEEAARRHQAGETVTAIAEEYGVGKSCLCHRLRAIGVKPRPSSIYSDRAIPCPFSPERLREMYWKEGMSLATIGVAALAAYDDDPEPRNKPIAQNTVTRWFKEAGIAIRTLSEARRERERYKAILAKNLDKAVAIARAVNTGRSCAAYNKKGRDAARKRNLARRITKPCELPGCTQTVTRPPSEFKHPHTFCCKSHSRKYQVLQQRGKKNASLPMRGEGERSPK